MLLNHYTAFDLSLVIMWPYYLERELWKRLGCPKLLALCMSDLIITSQYPLPDKAMETFELAKVTIPSSKVEITSVLIITSQYPLKPLPAQ